MNYEIKGGNMPVAICTLDQGETVVSESGAMGWMSENIVMDTNMKGGLFGGIGRALSGDSLFLNTFTCTNGQGTIAFPCSVPGKLLVKNLYQGQTLICQKGAFLAAETSVEFKIHLKKRISSGLFGGEGLFLTTLTGPGRVYLQTMPISNLASRIYPYIPMKSGN